MFWLIWTRLASEMRQQADCLFVCVMDDGGNAHRCDKRYVFLFYHPLFLMLFSVSLCDIYVTTYVLCDYLCFTNVEHMFPLEPHMRNYAACSSTLMRKHVLSFT